jgi:hypothetical protein
MMQRGLFEPDVLVRQQIGTSASSITREQRLMLAVLQSALDAYRKYASAKDPQDQKLFEEAAVWLATSNDDWLFSFERICEALDINPDYLRRGLDGWRLRANGG